MLEKELGVSSFEFSCRDILDRMHEEKLGHFDLEKVYGKPSSVLHSLEAFLGKIDFDRLPHYLYRGSMMASPSSTAAYLIDATRWDDEAEDYLRHVMRNGAGHGDGGIWGNFPTTHFECSWILATLLKGGFTVKQIDCDGLRGLSTIFADALRDENGVIGFAPHSADVDDTAKVFLALSLINQHSSPDIMVKVFEGKHHSTTFGSERDLSLSSNLHVILSLLNQPDLSQYHPQILNTTFFICLWWWDSDYCVKDKWNLSHLYPTILYFWEKLFISREVPSISVQPLKHTRFSLAEEGTNTRKYLLVVLDGFLWDLNSQYNDALGKTVLQGLQYDILRKVGVRAF